MGTHIFDLDGTVFKFHTNEWLPGAKEYIQMLLDMDNSIIFVTARGAWDGNDDDEIWNPEDTKAFMEKEFPGIPVITGVKSPRFIYDDHTPFAVQREQDSVWREGMPFGE